MAYTDKIQNAQKKAYSNLIATKILDLMDKLRLNSKGNASRRWIWELLQNAKDVSYDNGRIETKINLDTNRKILEFSHNGNPFTSENITFLIEQVSTKERTKNKEIKSKTTGKFGTGFITTHLLSEVVTISGVLKDPDEPYKKFELTLDRSGRSIESIIKSIENSIEELNRIDSMPDMNCYFPDNFNTKFTYKLDEQGELVAKKGITDLTGSLIFTLVFLPQIKSVYIDNLNTKYELLQDYEYLSQNIKLYTLDEICGDVPKHHKIIVLSRNDVTIAISIEKINNRIFLKELSKNIPKIFCDFPLIGTEDFPFPTIINSPNFNPNEPRDGIYLTDSSDEKIIENKSIMLEALKLYYELIDFASKENWGNMYLFASKVNSVLDKEWLSNKWITNEISNKIKDKLLSTPIIDTQIGRRIAIKNEEGKFNIWFPSNKDKTIRNKIWELCSYWIPSKLPLKEDIDSWYDVLWAKCRNLTMEELTSRLQEKKDIKSLQNKLGNSIDVIEWLNLYYELLNDESIFIENIIGDKYSVIPNQNGVLKKRTELKIDKDIEEELKNVLCILGEDCRDYLIHKNALTGEKIGYYTIEQKSIINKINEFLTDNSNKYINDACYYLISLFSSEIDFPKERETIYKFCRTIFQAKVKDKRKIVNWSKNIWENVDKKVILNLVMEISKNKNIEKLTEEFMFTDCSEALKWLNSLITFLVENGYDYLINHREMPILPNQNGNFVIKDDLFLDNGDIDNDLKDISYDLGYDFRKEILSMDIFLGLPQNRTKTQKDVADEISNMVKKKLHEVPISDEIKKIFRKLLVWFNENEDKAKEYFTDLYKNKHKLYDDAEIVENIEKAAKYDEIMDKFNIKDYKSLEKILESTTYYNIDESSNKQEITENILAQLGIFTPEELEAAFGNKVFSDNFVHVPDKKLFKFEYVQNIIKRSIDNVFRHLESKSEYKLEDCEEIAKTIFSVTKNDEDIYIIIRPSDYDQIIIYYDSEKDLLDYEKDCELWVDDGVSIPQKITFGKILKITGINKIPLKKIR